MGSDNFLNCLNTANMPVQVPFPQLRLEVDFQLPLSFFVFFFINVFKEFLDAGVLLIESSVLQSELLKSKILVEVTICLHTFRVHLFFSLRDEPI